MISLLEDAFLGICLTLDGLIYSFVSKLYRIYIALASARILSSDAFTIIANKVYVVIGVAMLFVLAYAILKAIIDPDQAGKGDFGGPKIIKGIITAVLGLALTPVLFNIIYQGQDIILKQNIIGKMFFASDDNVYEYGDISVDGQEITDGGTVKSDDVLYDDAGNVIAVFVWQAFFHPSDLIEISEDDIVGSMADYIVNPTITAIAGIGCAIGVTAGIVSSIFTLGFGAVAAVATAAACGTAFVGKMGGAIASLTADEMSLSEATVYASSTGEFGIFQIFIDNITDGEITYSWGLSSIVGIFVCYAFFSFSIDMAVRAAKLAYFQIIAPIPLILQVMPNFKSNFNKYVKNVVSTFLEVFIRISIIYVVVYIISHLNDLVGSDAALWANNDLTIGIKFLARALLICGLIIFAKQAPKLVSDTFGLDAGKMSLGIGKKLSEGGIYGAAAMIGAGVSTMASNAIGEWGKVKGANTWADKARHIRNGLISGAAGGVSASARAGKRAAVSWAHNQPLKLKDVKDTASVSAQEAETKKTDRSRYRAEHGGTLVGVIKGHLEDARDNVVSALVGSVDTSYLDKQVKTFNDLASLKSLTEGTIEKDNSVKAAQRYVDDLSRGNAEDYAYAAALQKRAESNAREMVLGRRTNESETDYNARFNTWLAASEANRNAYEAKINEESENLRMGRGGTSGTEKFARSDYSVVVGSEEYKRANEALRKEREAADEALKKAKDDAVARKMMEYQLTGVHNDTSRAVMDFVNEHQAEFREFANADFNGQKLGDYLRSSFGSNVLKGMADFGTINHNLGNQNFEVALKNNGKVFVKYDTGSDVPTYILTDNDGHRLDEVHSQGELEAAIARAGLNNEIESSKTVGSIAEAGGVYSSSGEGSATSISKTLKSEAEKARDEFVSSAEYRDAHARARKQQEKK